MENEIRLTMGKRRKIALVLIVMSIFYVFDLYADWEDGDPLSHLLMEAFCLSSGTIISAILWRSSFSRFDRSTTLYREHVASVEREAAKWKADATRLLAGLSVAIDAQFGRWQLTPAEREVALFLLKGFSYNEIAELRKTSERTVREQSSTVYQKSNLEGRAQLAAFFLEDLDLPSHSSTIPTGATAESRD